MMIFFATKFEAFELVELLFVFDLLPFTSKDIPALNPQVPLEAAAAAAVSRWAAGQ